VNGGRKRRRRHPDSAFTLPTIARQTGASERQLHHWIERGLIDPIYRDRGGPRRFVFTPQEIAELRIIVRLVKAGLEDDALTLAKQAGVLEEMLREVRSAADAGVRYLTSDAHTAVIPDTTDHLHPEAGRRTSPRA
jgi:hypothetical protein